MTRGERLLQQRKIYYDHEPVFRALQEKGETGWRSGGKAVPWAKCWKLFQASECLPKPKARVLDFGCGGGEFSILLARQGYRVVGTDYSPTAIAMARANARKSKIPKSKIQNLKFLRQDALHPQLRAASFDLIASLCVLHCFTGKDRMIYWRNVRKLLKKGGLFALTSMVDLPNNPKMLRQLKINPKTRVDINRTRCFASEDQILAEAKAAGLEVIFHARQKDPDGSDGLTVIARKN